MALVLVAEADPVVRARIAAALRREGFAVSEAGRPAEALDRWARERPALVLLGPGPVAPALCRRIKAASASAVIARVGAGDAAGEQRAFEAGADDCAAEPLSPTVLALRARPILRRVAS